MTFEKRQCLVGIDRKDTVVMVVASVEEGKVVSMEMRIDELGMMNKK